MARIHVETGDDDSEDSAALKRSPVDVENVVVRPTLMSKLSVNSPNANWLNR